MPRCLIGKSFFDGSFFFFGTFFDGSWLCVNMYLSEWIFAYLII